MPYLSDQRKLDIVFKAFVGREETTTEKAWFEEYPGHATILHASEIWTDPIPETPPSTSTETIRKLENFTLTEDNTVANHRAWKIFETPGDTSSARITGLIHPRFGQGYTARIYDASDSEIPTTHPAKWIILYELGIIIFEENPLAHGINLPIKITAYHYRGRTLGTGISNLAQKWAMIMS